MFPCKISKNIDILAVMTVQKMIFGFYGDQKTQGQKHQLNTFYFKYQACQIKRFVNIPIKAANRRRKKVVNAERKNESCGQMDRGIQPPSIPQPILLP